MGVFTKWRVVNAEPDGYSAEARRLLSAVADLDEHHGDRQMLLAALAGADALIVRLRFQIDGELFDHARNLKAVVSATTGLDHIDLERARAVGVAILSLKGETAFLRTIRATAEHTWALLLALLRKVPAADASVRSGAWTRDAFRGRELHGRNLRLIGLGRVGRQVAGYGLAFGMSVAACDPFADDWMPGVERRSDLDALVADADVISIHVPLDAATRTLIDRRCLERTRSGAVLINTSRGEVLDEAAVVEALRDGRLAGAAVDVLASERHDLAASPLAAYLREADANLIVTPHIGGATVESMARTEVFMAERLAAFIRAHPDAAGGRA